jgi:hypothetical protein
MPEYYIEFNERLRCEAACYKLGKEAVQERVQGYTTQLVQSFCNSDELCTITRTIIGGFHICIVFDITVRDEIGIKK